MQFMLFPSLMSIPVHIAIHAEDLGFDAAAGAAVLSSIVAVSIIGRDSSPLSRLRLLSTLA